MYGVNTGVGSSVRACRAIEIRSERVGAFIVTVPRVGQWVPLIGADLRGGRQASSQRADDVLDFRDRNKCVTGNGERFFIQRRDEETDILTT